MSGCALSCSRPSDIDEYVYSAVRAGASGFLLEGHPARAAAGSDSYGAPRRCSDCASATRRLLEQMIPVLDSRTCRSCCSCR